MCPCRLSRGHRPAIVPWWPWAKCPPSNNRAAPDRLDGLQWRTARVRCRDEPAPWSGASREVGLDGLPHRQCLLAGERMANEHKSPCKLAFLCGLGKRCGPLGATRVQNPAPPPFAQPCASAGVRSHCARPTAAREVHSFRCSLVNIWRIVRGPSWRPRGRGDAVEEVAA